MSADSGSVRLDFVMVDRPRVQTAPSFREVFDAYAPYVWRTLRRLGVGEADVNDVCQEVFVVVHRRLGDFDGRSTVRTWLYGICIRTASQYRRGIRNRREEMPGELPEPAMAPVQEDAIERLRARDRLDLVLDRLDEAKRAVFVLYE